MMLAKSFFRASSAPSSSQQARGEWMEEKSLFATYIDLIIFQFQFLQAPQLRKDRIADESQLVEAHIQHFQISQSFEDLARQFTDTVIA